MTRRKDRSGDLNKLVRDSSDSDLDPGSTNAPVIQISHPNVPEGRPPEDDGGVSNPVFSLGDEEPAGGENDGPPSSESRTAEGTGHGAASPGGSGGSLPPVETVESEGHEKGGGAQPGMPPLQPSDASPGLSRRRGSHHLTKSNSLAVPDGLGSTLRRRHSLGADDSSDTSPLTSSHQLSPGSDRGRSGSVTSLEIERLERRRGSQGSVSSQEDMDRRMSSISSAMSERLKDLARRFSERTERYKEQVIQPPTPSTGDSMESKSAISGASAASEAKKEEKKKAEEAAKVAEEEAAKEAAKRPARYWENKCCKVRVPGCWETMVDLTSAIDPQSRVYLGWLALISAVYVYNAMASTLRAAFRAGPFYVTEAELEAHRLQYSTPTVTGCVLTTSGENGSVVTTTCFTNETVIPPFPVRWKAGFETDDNRYYWWAFDYTCDFLYLVDILLVRGRISFINNGLFETNIVECWKNYKSKTEFRLDLLSMLPLDLFYLIPGFEYNAVARVLRMLRYDILSLVPLDLLYLIPQLDYFSLVRLPRILRIHIFWEFFDRVDQVAKSGYIIRVIRTLTYMLFLIHLESCGYYAMSAYEGFGLNSWVYSGQGNAYIRCAYLATKTATSIGNNPRPHNTLEYGFMTAYWLSGVFVFAMLIGQIRDIFQSATASETLYRRSMDRAVSYMQGLNVPKELQNKVRSWFNYNWQHQKTLNENSLLDGLPVKMIADLQIAVHYQTLSKVQLFQDCEKNLLYDLVVKLKPCLYLPHDYICKKGEVGTEMYIVKQGQVEVVGGENDSIVFATLHEGSVFGEISLLGIQGGNRRTANVRSKGYSNLFLLTKIDFEAAMADYPDAHKLLKRRSKKVLAKNKKKVEESKKVEVEEIIKQPEETPKMVKTVISLINPASRLQERLRSSSLRRGSYVSGMGTPTESLRGDLDLLSNCSDDEILRIEREERPLTADEATNLNEDGRPLATPEPAVVITMEPLRNGSIVAPPSDDIENSAVIPPPPPDGSTTEPETKPAHAQPNGHVSNKVHPAEVTMEKETPDKPSERKKKPKSGKLQRSNRIEPMNGGPPEKGGKKKNGKPQNGRVETGRKEDIGGGTETESEQETPGGNIITCDVEVHRAKSPSVTSMDKVVPGQQGQNEPDGQGPA